MISNLYSFDILYSLTILFWSFSRASLLGDSKYRQELAQQDPIEYIKTMNMSRNISFYIILFTLIFIFISPLELNYALISYVKVFILFFIIGKIFFWTIHFTPYLNIVNGTLATLFGFLSLILPIVNLIWILFF